MADTDTIRPWHRRPWAGWAIRACGLLLLLAAWRAWADLVAHGGAAADIGTDDVLAVVAFLGASLGLASALLGAHLFDQVAIASRWGRSSLPDSGERAPGPFDTPLRP